MGLDPEKVAKHPTEYSGLCIFCGRWIQWKYAFSFRKTLKKGLECGRARVGMYRNTREDDTREIYYCNWPRCPESRGLTDVYWWVCKCSVVNFGRKCRCDGSVSSSIDPLGDPWANGD